MAVDGRRFMTKTQHYRKVTKPLLERKRRARMNLYLDELKDLIVDTMEAHGDQVNKLEKADILEMTVNYLKTHKHEFAASAQSEEAGAVSAPLNLEKFRAGYTQAAYEVSKVFATLPGIDLKFGAILMKHLGFQLKDVKPNITIPKPHSVQSDDEFVKPTGYPKISVARRRSADQEVLPPPMLFEPADDQPKGDDVWRPW